MSLIATHPSAVQQQLLGERLRKFALLLDQSGTATAALLAWCQARGIGHGEIEARRRPGLQLPAASSAGTSMAGRVGPLLTDRHGNRRNAGARTVVLSRGGNALSQADIIYNTDVLSRKMRDALRETSAPFGRVVQPLDPRRLTTHRAFAPARALTASQVGLAYPVLVVHATVFSNQIERPIARVRESYMLRLIV